MVSQQAAKLEALRTLTAPVRHGSVPCLKGRRQKPGFDRRLPVSPRRSRQLGSACPGSAKNTVRTAYGQTWPDGLPFVLRLS